MAKDSCPKYPYGPEPPQEILDKVQALHTCQSEINYVKDRLAVLHRQEKQLSNELEVFRASLAPISQLPVELLCIILMEVVGDGDYEQASKLSLVCRAWRRAVIGTPQLWVTLSVSVVNDMDRMIKQHRMIEMVLERSKGQRFNVSIDFTSYDSLQTYIAECIEDAFPPFYESSEIADWVAASEWKSLPVIDAITAQHRCVFDTLIGLDHENTIRWRSLDVILPWEEGSLEMVLPILRTIFEEPECGLVELEFHGHSFEGAEDDAIDLQMPEFVALQHLKCAGQFDLSMLEVSTTTLKSLDCADIISYRNLPRIYRFESLHTLRYRIHQPMVLPPGFAHIRLPTLRRLYISGAPHKDILDIFVLPHLSVLSVTFHKSVFVDGVVPQSDIFSTVSEIIWRGDDSFFMNGRILSSLVQQCTSAINITVEESWKAQLVEIVLTSRLQDPGEFAQLQTIWGCDEQGERTGTCVDVSIDLSQTV